MKRRHYPGRDVQRALGIEELRGMARRRTPNFCFEYVEGGSDDEVTLRRNRAVFDDIALVPRALVDVTTRDQSVDLLGGRQLDGAISSMEALQGIVAKVKGRLAIMLDGGLRRGTDIVKASVMGADAVLVGRAGIYGLAAGGKAGASRAISILKAEIDRTLGLLGCPDISDLAPDMLRSRAPHMMRSDPAVAAGDGDRVTG